VKQKRLATILYVDITGFSKLTSHLGPEKTTEFVNKCFKTIDSIIHLYDGTIIRHEGDRVMAAFGFPTSQGNDSYCAIASAHKIQEAFKKPDQVIETHIGIATGEIVCDNDKIYGYVTETASQLEEIAPGGEIYIDRYCYELNKTLFEFESLSKGKHKFYRLLSEKKPQSQHEGTFFDRKEEMKALRQFISNKEKIVIISGEQGSGKTRLIHETITRSDPEHKKYRFIQTSFLSTRSLSFYDAILKILLELRPDYQISNDVSLLSESSYEIRLYNEFLDILFTAGEEKPLIILFQYFERIDKNSLEFIKYLINNIEGHPLTLICEMDKLHSSIRDTLKSVAKFDLQVIDLPPLSKEYQANIISELLAGIDVPDSIQKEITRHSSGNPLFITEICRYLKAQHAIDPAIQEIKVPYRIREVMNHLIDHIPLGIFNTLAIGALYGYTVNKEFLAIATQNFKETLNYGLSHGLIVLSNGEITFKSPFLRDEICNRIPKSIKQELHRKIASVLREKSRDSDTDKKLAYHFREAGDHELALHYSLKWARKLKSMHQNDLALEAYNDAHQVSRDLDHKAECSIVLERVELYNLLGMRDHEKEDIDYLEEIVKDEADDELEMEFIVRKGRYLEGISSYEHAIELYKESLERRKDPRLLERLGMAYYSISAFDEATANLKEALAIARDKRNIKQEALIRGHLGVVYWKRGEKEKSLDYSRTALDLFLRLGDTVAQARITANMGNVYYYLSKYDEALDAYKKALDVANEIGDVNFTARMLTNSGSVYAVMGEYEQSLAYYEQALKVAETTMNKKWEAIIINNIGDIYATIGKYKEALSFFQEALAISEYIGDKAGCAIRYGNIGDCYAQLGNLSKAIENLQIAHDIAIQMDTMDWVSFYKNELAIALIQRNDHAEAIELLREAIKIAKKAQNISYEINALSTLSLAYLQSGNALQSLKSSQNAIELLDKVEVIEGNKSSIYYNHYQALKQSKKGKLAQTYLKKAFDDIKARGDRISNDNFRTSFFSNIKEHQKIIREWKASSNPK
jgi:tetratricopeptide (TPR) repeat protein